MTEPTPIRATRRDPVREERLEVLRMVEQGIITADEAASLLDALDRAGSPVRRGADGEGGREESGEIPRLVRIRVTDSDSGDATVNLAVPIGLIESGLNVASQFVPEYLPDAKAIRESITGGFHGPLLDVDDGEQRVEIVVE